MSLADDNTAAFERELQRVEKLEECGSRLPRQVPEPLARAFRFAAVPENGFFRRSRPSVVQQSTLAADGREQPETPQRWRAPLAARRQSLAHRVSQLRTQIVEQQIGVGLNRLARELGPSWQLARDRSDVGGRRRTRCVSKNASPSRTTGPVHRRRAGTASARM